MAETSHGADHDVPVLIVGGGPVGLALAAELGLRGIAVALGDDRVQSQSVDMRRVFFENFPANHIGRPDMIGLQENACPREARLGGFLRWVCFRRKSHDSANRASACRDCGEIRAEGTLRRPN